jgi:DNA-3-methyladenine glycosylase II
VADELTPERLRCAAFALAARDEDLARLLREDGVPPLWARRPGFACLVHMILEQQVSLASARACFDKLRAELGRLTPRTFLTLSDGRLERIGFSRQKTAYCRGLAQALLAKQLDLRSLERSSDAQVCLELRRLKGIGTWTAEVYLLMALRRPDVWPAGDLALATAVQQAKALRARPDPDRLRELARAWKPWRSVAARMLWQNYLKRRKIGSGTPR